VQAAGVFQDIRQHYPNDEIVLLTSPAFKSLMQRCPHIDKVITDPRAPLWQLNEQYQLIKVLRQEKVTLVIDLQNSQRSRLYRQLIFKNTHWLGRLSGPEPESGLKGLITLLQAANISVSQSLTPNIAWMADNIRPLLQRYAIATPFIALIPGCSAAHPEKRWPFYPELAQRLLDEGFEVVNILGPEEQNLVRSLPGHTLIEQHGLLSWFELAGLLNQASFVIGNDTGPSHIASCLGRPGLALFGSTTSVARSELRRGSFNALKVDDLQQLSVESVLAAVLPKLPIPNPRPATPTPLPNY